MKVWNGWLTRFKRRDHTKTFLSTLSEIEQFKALIGEQDCLGCQQKSLQLEKFQRNPNGWEAEVSCKNCNTHGLVNSEGFEFAQIHSRGKATK